MAKIDLEAIHKIEQALIGVIVQQNDVLDRLRIDDTMLISVKAKLAFRAAKKMRDEQREFDAIVLADVEPKIGLDWVTQAFIDASKSMVDEYVDRIRAFQRSKRLLESLDEIKATLSKDGFDAAMDAYARTLRDLETGSDEPSVSIIKAMSMASTRIAENAGKRYGFPTGIESLDAIIGGFAPGIPTIIGARPGAGKSSCALAIAKANALSGNGVHVFTLEDSTETYAQRLMALESRTPTNLLRVGRINTAQQAGITKAFGKYAGVNWRLDESNADKPEEIVRRVRMQASQNQTKIVIIDFLQIVAHSMREPSEHQALTRCMNEFARAAKRDNMAYVIMSQLNRQVEERQDKRPTRSDFRGSGSIEEYAKVMIGLYRGSYYHDEPIEGIDYPNGGHKPTPQEFREQIHMLVLKNNNGPVGNTVAKWRGEFCEITD